MRKLMRRLAQAVRPSRSIYADVLFVASHGSGWPFLMAFSGRLKLYIAGLREDQIEGKINEDVV